MVLILIWLFVGKALRAKFLDPVWLFLALFGLLILFRVVAITFGLDTPFPDNHFAQNFETEDALFRATVASIVFLLATTVAYFISERFLTRPSRVLPFADSRVLTLDAHRRVVFALGLMCAAVLLWVLATSGGLSQAIVNQKFARQGTVSIQLRSVGVITASLGIAYALKPDLKRAHRLIPLMIAVIGAVTAFAWGARDGAVFPLITAMLFWARNRRGIVRRRNGLVTRLLAAGSVVGAVTVGLRVARDLLAKSELEQSLVGQSPIRQVSVSANLVQFDAALLGFRDWPSRFEFTGIASLSRGAQNWVPTILGGPADTQLNGNVELARLYEPQRTNGWPHTSLGEWWIAAGWAGVILAGLICGVVLVWLRRSYKQSASDPLQLMMVVILTVVVFQFGVREVTFSRFLTICVPLIALDRLAGVPSRQVSTLASSTQTDPVRSRRHADL